MRWFGVSKEEKGTRGEEKTDLQAELGGLDGGDVTTGSCRATRTSHRVRWKEWPCEFSGRGKQLNVGGRVEGEYAEMVNSIG